MAEARSHPSLTLARRLARTPVLGPAALALRRTGIAAGHVARAAGAVGRWLATSREVTNFTYDLTARSREQLAAFVAHVAEVPLARAEALLEEIEGDETLREHVRAATAASPDRRMADPLPRYGRRLGWYALTRALRPRVVVEAGVDKGLGAVVFAAALERNSAEGAPGFYWGLDRNPAAGFLLGGPYARCGRVLIGDAIELLKEIDGIGLFLHDSDHSAAYEAREYETLEGRLAEGALVLSDNAHVTPALYEFARRSGRRYLFFAEQPRGHWTPGAGIGAAFP